jgi:hypothetical protein
VRKRPASAYIAAALALLAGCGSTTAGQHPAAHHSTTAAAAVTGITCRDIDTDLVTVLSDLKTMDKHLQEAWVSGGDSGDLQNLISDTQDADPNGNQVNMDAATFNQDASAYLSDNSPYLVPGWQSGYGQVTSDINALATDCGQPNVPANTPANS